ncbi:general transcription factor IIF subunit 2-like [Dendronephthya gigantea]|uniref:general transcription factor IIF subunit 2-like n=1 Tax=Dendronephthya gigantea TaxID=151771 RepID=UPI00106A24B8|nr:general transcription factor IIF subunit 2-like [Dendronephthya gigantea]
MTNEIDCSGASHPVWLVKVPKYLASVLNHADDTGAVGTLLINKNPKEKEVIFRLSESLVQAASEGSPAPSEYKLTLLKEEQSRAVFSEAVRSELDDNVGDREDEEGTVMRNEICLEGVITQRGDCRATQTPQYMNLKKNSMLSAMAPVRKVEHLPNIVSNVYKPISQHKQDEEHEKKKKQDGKRARADKDYVLDLLFKAFERHQYYFLKDLIKITQQPVEHLKEILKSICIYNTKNPHKNMWELKPEYRHYDTRETPT